MAPRLTLLGILLDMAFWSSQAVRTICRAVCALWQNLVPLAPK